MARYISEVFIYVLLAVSFITAWRRDGKVAWPKLGAPILALGVVALISWLWNLTPWLQAVLGIRMYFRFIALYFVVYWLKPDEKAVRRIFYTIFSLAILETVVGLIQLIVGEQMDSFLLPSAQKFFDTFQLTTGTDQFWESGQRIFATMGRYDQLGTFLCLAMMLGVSWCYETLNDKTRHTLLIILGAMSVALAFTYSRASWFGFILGFLVIALAIKKDKRVAIAGGLVVTALVAYMFYTGLVVHYLTDRPNQTLTDRLFEAFSYERWSGEYYGLGRLFYIVQTPLKVVASSPLVGVGPGSYGGGTVAATHYTAVYDRLRLPFGIYGTEGHIDDNWFSLWGELGTVGLIIYMYLLLRVAVSGYLVYKKDTVMWWRVLGLGLVGMVLALSLQAMLSTAFEIRTLAVYFWLVAGLVGYRLWQLKLD